MKIHDVSGSSEQSSLRPLWYKDTDLFMIVYSIDNKESFQDIKNKWLPEIEKYLNKGQVPIVIVGNKLDKRDKNSVSKNEAENLAKEVGAKKSLEANARQRTSVQYIFDQCLRVMNDFVAINNYLL